MMRYPCSVRWAVAIRFRAEVKGISPTRGNRRSSSPLETGQAARKAVSVGSPVRTPPSPSSALLQRAASSREKRARGLSRGSAPRAEEKATTVILFWVRVPVLSEQITPVLPRVSTAGMCRTMARFCAMRPTPMASTMVTTAVRPSGMAATPRLMAMRNISRGGVFWSSPRRKITPQMAVTPMPSTRPVCFSRCCRGVWGAFSRESIRAIFPMAVSIPMAATTPAPAPVVMPVPANTMFFRSPRGASSLHRAAASFSTGTDSPVRADSSARSSTAFTSRMSAGTRSPARRMTTSPGTSWLLSTVCLRPSRTTVAWGEDSFFRAAMAWSAFHSCTVPITALHTTMARMMTGSA